MTEKSLRHDPARLTQDSADLGVIYVCNPNNPTGTVTPLEWIRSIVQNKDPDTVVIVDEAYAEFSSTFESALKLVAEGEDVVVLRTFSKIYGLAGLRCGAAFARADLLSKVEALSTNPVPVTALAAAQASLTSASVVDLRRAENRRRRNELLTFFDLEGISYVPSETNFVLFNTSIDGLDLVRGMRKHNIALPPPPRGMPNHVRVTIGSSGDMERFKQALLSTIRGA